MTDQPRTCWRSECRERCAYHGVCQPLPRVAQPSTPAPSGAQYRCGRCRDGEHHRCAEPGTCRCTINPDTGQEAT
jgi:hypothetical protein